MALFSRRKTTARDAPASTNPFVLAGQAVRAEQEEVERQAALTAQEITPRKGGRPMAENPRTRRVSMSLTEDEHATWTTAAGGRSLSAWARDQVAAQLLSGRPDKMGTEVARLRADLGRMGSNLNQLTRAVNSGRAPADRELLEAVQATRQELARLRGELA